MGGLWGRLPGAGRSYAEAAIAAKRICQGGLLLVQHCAPAGQEEELNRELQPETVVLENA